MTYPYSNEDLIYDFKTHKYILTKDCVLKELGIDLDRKYRGKSGNSQIILKRVSDLIYAHIHKHNANTLLQDFIIAKTESGRNIVKEAMLNQLLYMSMVGDLSMSSDKAKREIAIDFTSEEALLRVIPEIGTTILYTGSLGLFCPKDTTEW